MASCESTGRELSFEWSHHRISSIDSKVRVTLHNPLKHSSSEGVNSGDLFYIYSINPLSGVYLDLFFQWLYIIFQTVTRLFTKIKLQKWGIHSADFEKVSENEIQQSFVVVVKRF